ncbi:hypothetical protein F2Q69_00004879 [Brassica cretica]|uniref:Uncharacterized protein n=1 Tax=Brassica cretica TaxID=69181 RepID=A0A8S9PC24_BRACR|nr:hypothetical protein F2Q69_00004879 [Brassica cretica]
MSLSASPILQTGVPGVYHSTFESLSLGSSSSQNIVSGLPPLLEFPKLQERQGVYGNHSSLP